jgi:hypothetical protein
MALKGRLAAQVCGDFQVLKKLKKFKKLKKLGLGVSG